MSEPAHVTAWRSFLDTVRVEGPIPITFRVFEDALGVWILESAMLVADRETGDRCRECGRDVVDRPIIIQNELPTSTADAEVVVRQRVLGHYQHEALEHIHIGGVRRFDPHGGRWYSNLVADWRFNR